MQVLSSGASKVKLTTALALACAAVFSVNALTVSPARMEMNADPGKSLQGKFLIINEQGADQTYYTSVENFEAQGETGTPSFSATNKDGFASWVKVIDKVEIKRGDRIEVPFSVEIPTNADPGGHFAAIFLSTAPPSVQGSEVSIGTKIGMLMLLRVSGNIKEDGGILAFTIKDGKTIVSNLPVSFSYRFGNKGNDRVNPSGTIAIKNMIGMKTVEINPNPAQGNVLPNSVRKFDAKWGPSVALADSASFFDTVSYQWRNFALGMYTADINLRYGSAGTSNDSLTFYVFPWQLLLVIVIALAALWYASHLIIKHHDKVIIQQLRKMQRRREN